MSDLRLDRPGRLQQLRLLGRRGGQEGRALTDQLPTADRFGPVTLKHLDFIEAVIARLAGNSFLLKGWALTVAAAFFGFSAKEVNWRIAAVGLLPVLAFWALDGYFLHRERLFRKLYDAVVTGDPPVPTLSMNYGAFKSTSCTYRQAICAITVKGFYGALAGVGLILILITALHWGF